MDARADQLFELVPHRTLQLPGGQIAVLSRESTAWVTLPQEQYADLAAAFPYRGAEERPRSVQQLWDAGLLRADGAANPATLRPPAGSPSSLLVKLTGACDYTCTYCYDFEPSRWSAKLQPDQVLRLVDGILRRRNDLSIVFHGGEPLLRFKTLTAIVEAVLERFPTKKLRFAVQTNGSHLSPEIVSFLDRHRFSVGISLDAHTETGNRHRTVRRGPTALRHVERLIREYPDFVKRRCGVVAVISRASVPHLRDFVQWLQANGFGGLSLSFLDSEGRGTELSDQRLSPDEAIEVYALLVRMIRAGEIAELGVRTLLSRIANLFTFVPTDFCHRGPCAAADEFVVLDAEGRRRSCDCIYDAYFELGDDVASDAAARNAIIDRHGWLEALGPTCSTCALFGLCGGTCVAKAISVNGNPRSVDPTGCALVRYLYPELLAENLKDDQPLLDYYRRHRGLLQDGLSAIPL